MGRSRCDGCGASVRIAGGIGDLWSAETPASGGLTLELADGSEHFLCLACLDRLPVDPTAADVASLGRADGTKE